MSRVALPMGFPVVQASPRGPVEPIFSRFCGHCGREVSEASNGGGPVSGGETSDGGEAPPSDAHRGCGTQLQLEPPRYCRRCGRRLKVQVTPLGWSANCSRHGNSSG